MMLADLRYGIRTLAKAPAFTAIAVLSLALGIGGSTAMYSVIHAVILDPFPYKDPHRLVAVTVRGQRGGNGSYYTIDDFLEIAQRNSVFSGVIASTWSDVTWTDGPEPQRLRGNHCTMNTFDVMGVPPLLGRATTPSDAAAGAEPVTVLGYKFWQKAFGGDPRVLGRKLALNGKTRTVIGVMPPRFMWRGADVYLPDVFHRGETVEGEREVHLMGRMKPGITRAQVEADLHPIIADLQRQHPDDFPPAWRLEIRDFGETFPSGIRDALWILFGAVGLLLLIACANVGNLLLSRGAYRMREIAIRAAMGAGRARLVRQLLAESLLLALAGGAAGIAVAWAALRGIISMVPPNTIPDEAHIALDLPVLLFTLGISIAAALLFGLLPALEISGRDLAAPLREAGRGASSGRLQRLARGGLVAGEVALSLMLLVGASLMVRTLVSIQGAAFAFHPDRILTLRVPLAEQRYPDVARRNTFLQDLLGRVQSVPGVVAASINSGLPPVYEWGVPVVVPGSPQTGTRGVVFQQVNEQYPAVMGVRLVQGRFLTAQDVSGRLHYTVVNQAFVRLYFPDAAAVGRVVRLPALRGGPFQLQNDAFEILGVVRDTVNRAASNEIVPEMYVPFTIFGRADRLLVLTAGRPETFGRAVKAQVYACDPLQPVTEEQSMETLLRQFAYASPRFNLLLFSVFALVGLALALFGIYGVMSHAVAQQTREIGIRIALGATFGDVIAMVLGMSARVLAIGIVIGLIASLSSVKLLASLVRKVSPFDPYSFAAVSTLLMAAGLFAAFWPARRAARIDPVSALRE